MAKDYVVSNKIIKMFGLKSVPPYEEIMVLMGEDGNLYRLADVMKVILDKVGEK